MCFIYQQLKIEKRDIVLYVVAKAKKMPRPITIKLKTLSVKRNLSL